MNRTILLITLLTAIILTTGCNTTGDSPGGAIPVILDTDTNNELDDQHAIAYQLFNGETIETVGITVNATYNGGAIGEHVKEAERVIELCGFKGKLALMTGANGNFSDIRDHLNESGFEGHEAVEFIIDEALKKRNQKLVLLPVGKLTNIALALKKEPRIAKGVRIVWLGSNHPGPGEYNLENDIPALNYILDTEVPFEMVTVRYGETSGTSAVKVKRKDVYIRMPGLGPHMEEAVEGRHGNRFHCFGDYSVDLFRHIEHLEDGCYRSLYDMAAVAIVKNPEWASPREIPAPHYGEDGWEERPGNSRKILIWENFDKKAILDDFFTSLEN